MRATIWALAIAAGLGAGAALAQDVASSVDVSAVRGAAENPTASQLELFAEREAVSDASAREAQIAGQRASPRST